MQNFLEFSDCQHTDSDTGSVNVLAESSGRSAEPLHKGAPIVSVDFKIFRGRIEKYADEWARKYVAPALAGNEEAALSLAAALSNRKRGDVTVAFWRARAPRAAFRQLLNIVWSHDHAELIKAAGSRRRLSAIFRYAQFSTEGLPPVVLVWRGASGSDVARVGRGYSWTLDRDVACWFAMRKAGAYGSPVVLRAEVPREAVALHDNARGENEVVLLTPPAYAIDGNEHEWPKRFQLFEDMKDASYRAWLNSLKCRNDQNRGGAPMGDQSL